MLKNTIILIILLLFILLNKPNAAEIISPFEDYELEKSKIIKDSFIGLSGGIHEHSLSSYNKNLEDLNELAGNAYKMDKLNGETYEGEVIFGYRLASNSFLISIGAFKEVKAESRWYTGQKGSTSISAYFVDFTYRYYLLGKKYQQKLPEAGLLLPYIGGGLGWYQADWSFNDPNILMVDMTTGERIYNPEGKGDDIGYHLIGGFDIFLSKNISLNLQGGYRWITIDEVSAKVTTQGGSRNTWIVYFGDDKLKLDLSGITLNVGVSFHWF